MTKWFPVDTCEAGPEALPVGIIMGAGFTEAAIADLKAEWERLLRRPVTNAARVRWGNEIECPTHSRADRVKATESARGSCAWCVRDGINVLSRGAPLVTFEGRTVCATCGHLSGHTPCPVRECAHALEPRWTLAHGVVQGCPVHGPGAIEDEW